MLAVVPTAIAAGPSENLADETVGPPPVSVPVILDGVPYKADEFNRIHSELYAKGIYIGSLFDSDNGILIAFTSIEGFEAYTKEHGLPSIKETLESAKKAEPASIVFLDPKEKGGQLKEWPTMVSNWENINYGGSGFGLSYGVINNLHSSGWGDRISSIDVGSQRTELVWENINQSGEYHWFISAGSTNLHLLGGVIVSHPCPWA